MTQIYSDENLSIDCAVMRGAALGEYNIKAYFSSNSMAPLSAIALQVAVQKYMRM